MILVLAALYLIAGARLAYILYALGCLRRSWEPALITIFWIVLVPFAYLVCWLAAWKTRKFRF